MQFGFKNAFLIAMGAETFRGILEVRRRSNPVTLTAFCANLLHVAD